MSACPKNVRATPSKAVLAWSSRPGSFVETRREPGLTLLQSVLAAIVTAIPPLGSVCTLPCVTEREQRDAAPLPHGRPCTMCGPSRQPLSGVCKPGGSSAHTCWDADGTVKIWAAASGALIHTLKGHSTGILSIAASAFVQPPDPTTPVPRRTAAQRAPCAPPAVSATFTSCAAAAQQFATRQPAQAASTSQGGSAGCTLTGAALAARARVSPVYVVSGSADHSVRVWAVAAGRCVYCLRAHGAPVTSLRIVCNRVISIAGVCPPYAAPAVLWTKCFQGH